MEMDICGRIIKIQVNLYIPLWQMVQAKPFIITKQEKDLLVLRCIKEIQNVHCSIYSIQFNSIQFKIIY